MGIKGLTKIISDYAPAALKTNKYESYFGRKVAVDASMCIYQFMVVVGRVGDQLLTSESGDVTSHLQGILTRTTKMLEAGIKPVYVFDGKPPEAKAEELKKRKSGRDDAEEGLAAAKEAGDAEAVEKLAKRTVKVTKEHNEECKKLLRLMGVPVWEAPSEAEAECAAMAAAGKVYCAGTEDMDTLTFGAPVLARHLVSPATGKDKDGGVMEFALDAVLKELELTMDQFVDLCILCGCDYCPSIPKIGGVTALKLVKQHGSIERILEAVGAGSEGAKYAVPENWNYQEARRLFKTPDVTGKGDFPDFVWGQPDEEGLIQFMVREKSFQEDRIRSVVRKIKAAKGKSAQNRLESFFGAAVKTSSTLGKRKDDGKKPLPGQKGGGGQFSKFVASKAKKKAKK